MSVIIPVIFSIVIYKEELGFMKIIGILTAFSAVFLAVIRKTDQVKFSFKYAFYPLFLFFGSGTVDSLIKFTQVNFVDADNTAIFSSAVFAFAAIAGFIVLFLKMKEFRGVFNKRILFFGTLIGLLNFLALFSIIKALEISGIDSSLVFMINSIGVVGLSVCISILFYKEKPGILNWVGICLSLIAILILAYI